MDRLDSSLVLLPLLLGALAGACSSDSPRAVDSGVDSSADSASPDASVEASPDGATDAAADGSPDGDAATREEALGSRWLESAAGLNAEFCRCEITVRDYETVEECALAEGSTAKVRICADEVIAEFLPQIAGGFACVTDTFEQQASCSAAAPTCDVDALNACEATSYSMIGACPPTPVDALDAFFFAIGECVRGAAGTCPDMMAADAARLATGNSVGAGNEFSASCAAGGDVAPDVTVAFTAPSAGLYRFDTFGSSFDTQLYAYESCGGGTELGCNEDAGDRRTSEIELTLTVGQSIVLVVDGFDELSAGDFVLNVTAP